MKLHHSAIRSPFFKLVTILEVDLAFDDESWPIRFELFRNTEKKGHYRCRIRQGEFHRLLATLPQKKGRPFEAQDALIFIDWGGAKMGNYDDFKAPSAAKAMKLIISDFKKFLKHTTGESPRQ